MFDIISSPSTAIIYDDGKEFTKLSYTQFVEEHEKAELELKNHMRIISGETVVGVASDMALYTPVVISTLIKMEAVFVLFSQELLPAVNKKCEILNFILPTRCLQFYVKIFEDSFKFEILQLQAFGGEHSLIKRVLDNGNEIVPEIRTNDGVVYNLKPNESTNDAAIDFVPNSRTNKDLISTSELVIPNGRTTSKFVYVVHTSGSTGQPKSVAVNQACFMPNVTHLEQIFNVNRRDVIFVAAALTFDASLIQIFLAWKSSCSLLVVSEQVRQNPRVLAACFKRHGVTILQCTPSLLTCNTLLPDTLRVLALGGEAFPPRQQVSSWKRDHARLRIFNIYGTTEVSAWASIHEITKDDFKEQATILNGGDWVPIGEPMLETEVALRKNDVTQQNHIWIGSKTRVCNIDFAESTTMECVMRDTGDLGCLCHRKIHYCGRSGSVVKRNGMWVNLREIENIARNIDGVDNCFVSMNRTKSGKVVLFYTSKTLNDIQVFHNFQRNTSLKCIPDDIIKVKCFPLTTHGKINKGKLFEIEAEYFREISAKTKGNVEELWTSSLCLTKPVKNTFVEAGGNSFIAAFLTNKLHTIFANHTYEYIFDKVLATTLDELIEYLRSPPIIKSHNKNHTTLKYSLPEVNKQYNLTCGHYLSFGKGGACYSCGHREKVQLSEFNPTILEAGTLLRISWQYDTGKCVDASPLIVYYVDTPDGVVYVGSHSGEFVALCLRTGDLVWRRQIGDRIESSATVSPDGRYICFGCYDGKLYVLECKTGSVHWTFQTDDIVKCSPLATHQLVIFGSYDRHIYAIDIQKQQCRWQIDVNSCCVASPVERHNLVYVSLLSGELVALGIDSGKVEWKTNVGKPLFTMICLCRDLIVAGCVDGCLYALDYTGTIMWQFATTAPLFSSPSVFLANDIEFLVFGSNDCHIYCVDTNDGRLVCKKRTESSIVSSVNITNNGKLIVASTNGNIHLLSVNVNTSTMVTKSSFRLPGEVFSSATISGESIVIGCRDNNIYCLRQV